MTKIIIIAGGLATRMHPITEQIPKCLVPINGKPLIEHQLEFFKKKGYTDFIFCVAHLADKVKSHLGDGTNFGVKIQYVQEQKELLGTAGSLKLTKPLLDKDNDKEFIVYYGDNITDMSFDAFQNFHRAKKGIATICMREAPKDYKGSSIIIIDDEKQVTTFIEKPTDDQRVQFNSQNTYINSGIYMFSSKVLDFIPENTVFDIAKQLFPLLMLLAKTNQDAQGVFGYPTQEFFKEIGRIEKYEQFCKDVAGKKSIFPQNSTPKKAVFLDRDGVINKNVIDLIKPEQFELIDGAPQAIRQLNNADYLIIIVTNQPIISKGFCSFGDMDRIHQKMKSELSRYNSHINAIYVCPHHPQSGFANEVKELKINCNCRKPKPGLFLEAISDFNIDISKSWMIGDSLSDVEAANLAKIKAILLDSRKQNNLSKIQTPNAQFQTLKQAVEFILESKD